jgi:hypothetical protein
MDSLIQAGFQEAQEVLELLIMEINMEVVVAAQDIFSAAELAHMAVDLVEHQETTLVVLEHQEQQIQVAAVAVLVLILEEVVAQEL